MRRELSYLLGLLVIVTLVSCGLCALAAWAADDGSMVPLQEGAMTRTEDDGQDDIKPLAARYRVTFIKSRSTDPLRSATVVSVTNQARRTCRIMVEWVRGFEPPSACTTTVHLDPGITTDLCSRAIPEPLTTCNATCDPELTFHEGRAVVHSSTMEGCERIGVSARVYYTTGDDDESLGAISDSKIVRFGRGNRGD